MSIVSKKDRMKAEKIIACILYIVENTEMDIESMEKIVENYAELSSILGVKGLSETLLFLGNLRASIVMNVH